MGSLKLWILCLSSSILMACWVTFEKKHLEMIPWRWWATRSKHYAVRVGRKVGVFETWQDCSKQVVGFKGAVFKAFDSRQQALVFCSNSDPLTQIDTAHVPGPVLPIPAESKLCPPSLVVAYTDGSCLSNGKTGAVAGIGVCFPNHPEYP
eukprot:c5552_g1_i1.p1 GENE.c5552_g1_i1~~c5552_g1_i1.p1  ORF type:complete len:150 (+),score=17.53 c5552_g1_i1:394-843(+)